MKLELLPYGFSICKVDDLSFVDFTKAFCFVCKTDAELSLVCITDDAPARTTARDDGWKAFRVQGVLAFSLVGVLSGISTTLANAGISIFAVSTFDTDYIFIKAEHFANALEALAAAGYDIAN